MSKFSFPQIQEIVKNYVDPTKIGSTTFVPSANNLARLIDKIGLIATYDGNFYDKLSMLDGEELPLGKTVEEYYQDLILPTDYDETGANSLAPNYPTYRRPCYSYSLGRKVISTTIKYNEFERACNNAEQYASLVSMNYKRLADSEAQFFYKMKKQGLGVLCDKVLASRNGTVFSTSAAYQEGAFLKKDSTPTATGVVMKKIESSNVKNWDMLVKEGVIVEQHMVEEIALPIDTTTGEAFIKQVKKDVETASFATEGYSLNGNTVGADNGLVLIIKKGINPVLDVDVLAGAFHQEKLALPAEIVVVDDFGDNTTCFGILADKRMLKLHNDYRATREQLNAKGDFLNLFRHTENTMHISLNTFVKVYKAK